MGNLLSSRRHHSRGTMAFLAAVVIALVVASGAPAQATETARFDPHAPVSNTGQVPSMNLASLPRGAREGISASSQGTGMLVAGGRLRATDAEVPAVPLLGEGVGIQSVIAPDGRFQITNTTAYPHRAIVHISSSIGGCSGWLIGANTVATAGHCIHNGAWATSVVVSPGRNGSSLPYGSCGATTLFSVVGWTVNRDRNYDYGAIKLNCTIGNTTGWFGFRWQAASLVGQPSFISGYPGDKPFGTQWRHDDQVRVNHTFRVYYANDTAGGQSGSPVWNNGASCSPCGIGIHAYAVDGTGFNGGTRITQAVFNNLLTWVNS